MGSGASAALRQHVASTPYREVADVLGGFDYQQRERIRRAIQLAQDAQRAQETAAERRPAGSSSSSSTTRPRYSLQAKSLSPALGPFSKKKLSKPTFTEDEISIIFGDFGMGEVIALGAASYLFLRYINDVDGDGRVLFQDCEKADKKYGEIFARKLRSKIEDLAANDRYVVLEVKAGDDPEFKDEGFIARIIYEGLFERMYTLSKGRPAVCRREEMLLHEIKDAKGKQPQADQLAKELRTLRWNVSEIISGEKILPFVRKNDHDDDDDSDSHPTDRKIFLWKALQKASSNVKVDTAVVRMKGGVIEIEFVYKPVFGKEALEARKESTQEKYTLAQNLRYAQEMLAEAEKYLIAGQIMKSGKRVWSVLYVFETQNIAADPIQWTDILLDLFNSLPAHAGEISASLDCFVRVLQVVDNETDREKFLDLNKKCQQIKKSTASFVRGAFDDLKQQAAGGEYTRELMNKIDMTSEPFYTVNQGALTNKDWILLAKEASALAKDVANEQASLFLKVKEMDLSSCIERLRQILNLVISELPESALDAPSGSFDCYSLLPTPTLPISESRSSIQSSEGPEGQQGRVERETGKTFIHFALHQPFHFGDLEWTQHLKASLTGNDWAGYPILITDASRDSLQKSLSKGAPQCLVVVMPGFGFERFRRNPVIGLQELCAILKDSAPQLVVLVMQHGVGRASKSLAEAGMRNVVWFQVDRLDQSDVCARICVHLGKVVQFLTTRTREVLNNAAHYLSTETRTQIHVDYEIEGQCCLSNAQGTSDAIFDNLFFPTVALPKLTSRVTIEDIEHARNLMENLQPCTRFFFDGTLSPARLRGILRHACLGLACYSPHFHSVAYVDVSDQASVTARLPDVVRERREPFLLWIEVPAGITHVVQWTSALEELHRDYPSSCIILVANADEVDDSVLEATAMRPQRLKLRSGPHVQLATPSEVHDSLCVSLFGIEPVEVLQILDEQSMYKVLRRVLQDLNRGVDEQALVGIYYEQVNGGSVLAVRLNVFSVQFLQRLRESVLNGHFERSLATAIGDVNPKSEQLITETRIDRTQFVKFYERSLTLLEELTPHQQERLGDISDMSINRHIRAPAGGGKTFVGLHFALQWLSKSPSAGDEKLLFVAASEALAYYFIGWLLRRLGPKKQLEAQEKIHVLLKPYHQQVHGLELKFHGGVEYMFLCNLPETGYNYDFVIVDEAHHVFSDEEDTRFVSKLLEKSTFILLSDESQIHQDVNFPHNTENCELTQIIRCSQKIVSAAAPLQANAKTYDVSQNVPGPALISRIFDRDETDLHVHYAKECAEAIGHYLVEYKLNLTGRLAIVVPKDNAELEAAKAGFKDAFREELSAQLRRHKPDFRLLSPQEASAILRSPFASESDEAEHQIVFGTVDELHGLEFLFVIVLGMDSQLQVPDAAAIRSALYRALTRAQMLTTVVNHALDGGYFDHLRCIEYDEQAPVKSVAGAARRVPQHVPRSSPSQQEAIADKPVLPVQAAADKFELSKLPHGDRILPAGEAPAKPRSSHKSFSKDETQEVIESPRSQLRAPRTRQHIWDTASNTSQKYPGENVLIPFSRLKEDTSEVPEDSASYLTDAVIHKAVDDFCKGGKDKQAVEDQYGKIAQWKTSKVTNMEGLFKTRKDFNEDISAWNVSSVTTMEEMFFDASSLDCDLSGWKVGNVTNMQSMFMFAKQLNCDLSGWDVRNVTDMAGMFGFAAKLNCNLGSWDVRNVTSMASMFLNAKELNCNLGNWDVRNVTNMYNMFNGASSLNCDLSGWNVGNVTNMQSMFGGATKMNCDVSRWDISKVELMDGMFRNSGFSEENKCRK